MYKEKHNRTASIVKWAAQLPEGTKYKISESGRRYIATLPSYKSPAGNGGQTVARVLAEHCGWIRTKCYIEKPISNDYI